MKLALFLTCLLAFITPLLCSCSKKEYTEVERVSGYRGDANRNPYYAAEKFLKRNGYAAKESSRLSFDIDEHDVVVVPASSIRGKAQANAILSYLRDGGHVICCLQYAEKDFNDFSGMSLFDSYFRTIDEDAVNELLEHFEMKLTENPDTGDGQFSSVMTNEKRRFYEVPNAKPCVISLDEEPRIVRLGGSWGVEDTALPSSGHHYDPYGYYNDDYIGEATTDDQEVHRFMSKQYSSGRFTVLSDGRFLRNPHLATQNHPSMLLDLVEMSPGSGSVLFSSGDNPSFFDLMWKHYPYFVIGLLVLVLLWLVGKFQRFGPILEIVYSNPLSFLHHVEASGHFLWKKKRNSFLLTSLQRRAFTVLRLDHLSKEKQNAAINEVADHLDVSFAEVERAINGREELDPNDFINSVRILQKIINHHD